MDSQKHYRTLLRIGSKICQTRKEQSLSQTELAKKAGIHRVRLSEIENGSPTSIITLIDILTALNRMDLLQSLTEPPKSRFKKVFNEVSSEVFNSAKELKADRSTKRSNVKLPDTFIEKYRI